MNVVLIKFCEFTYYTYTCYNTRSLSLFVYKILSRDVVVVYIIYKIIRNKYNQALSFNCHFLNVKFIKGYYLIYYFYKRESSPDKIERDEEFRGNTLGEKRYNPKR